MKLLRRALGLVIAASLALDVYLVALWLFPPTLDREGYFRNPALVDLFAPPVEGAYRASILKSFQTGTITITNGNSTNTGTITAVDTTNAVVLYEGSYNDSALNLAAASAGDAFAYLVLTNTTTVTATRGFTGDGGGIVVPFTVPEFYPHILNSAVQRGTITMAAGDTTKDATITSVNTAKTWLAWAGWTPTDTSVITTATANKFFVHQTLAAATTVRLTRGASGTFTPVAPYQVAEFRG